MIAESDKKPEKIEIAKIAQYIDDRDRVLTILTPRQADGAGKPSFRGVAKLHGTDENGLPAAIEFKFPIDATTIEEAYKKYEERAQEVGNEIAQEASKPKIAVAGGMPPPASRLKGLMP